MALEAVVLFKAWIVAGWFAAIFIAERMASAVPAPAFSGRLLTNGALWLIVLLVSPLIVLPLTAFAADHALWTWPQFLNGPAGVVLDILALDLWTYCVHRAYHTVPILWRFHAPHHFDEHLDSTSAFRFHFLEVVLSACFRMAPIVVLAMPFAHVVVFETLLLAATIFHHSNLRLPPRLERALSAVIVTPSIHWVHHHAVWRDTNSNYSGVFSLWDRLFGTRSATARTPEMKIGVEGLGDRPLLRLVLSPFTERMR